VINKEFVTITDTKYCPFYDACTEKDTDICKWDCPQCYNFSNMMFYSNLPIRFQHKQILDTGLITNTDVRDYIIAMYNTVDSFVNNGCNLYLYGDVGVGKTSWAVKMLTNYFAKIAYNVYDCKHCGKFVNVPTFLSNLKINMGSFSSKMKEFIEDLKCVDLVVWDDVYQTNPTSYESQILYSLINERLDNECSNIYTSNLNPKVVSAKDARLYSRICATSDCKELIGQDYRGGIKFSDILSNYNNAKE
jgi:DNA replication protein DnaC